MFKISVIVPVLNEEFLLQGCLDSLAVQSRLPDEVLVGIDAKTTDRSGEVAEAHPIVSRVVYGKKDTYSIQRVLCEEVSGNLIVNCDADTFLSSNWIEKAEQWLTNSKVHLVTGFIKPHIPNFINNLICNFQNGNPLYLSGCSSAFRKESLRKLTLDSYPEIPLYNFKALGIVVKDPELIAQTRIPTKAQLRYFREASFITSTLLMLARQI